MNHSIEIFRFPVKRATKRDEKDCTYTVALLAREIFQSEPA